MSRHPWDQISMLESVLPLLRRHPVILNQTRNIDNKGRLALTFSQDLRRV